MAKGAKRAKAAAKKTAGDSPAQTPEKVPQPHGGALFRGGVPGNKGGGRKSDEFRDRMAEMGRDPRALVYLRQCLRGKHGPEAFVKAYKYTQDQAHGKATQPVQLRSDPNAPATIIIRKE